MSEKPTVPDSQRVVAAEKPSEFVVADDHAVGSVTERKTFGPVSDTDDDMPLPTDPKTVFLGGLFSLAMIMALYTAAEIILPLVLAIVLKLLLQPLVRTLERFHVPRAIGAVLAVLLVLLTFGGAISVLAGPAAAWAGKLPEAIPKLRDNLVFLRAPIDAFQNMARQVQSFTGNEAGASSQLSAMKPSNLVGAVFSTTAKATTGLLTTLLILFYLLVSGETFLRRTVEVLPRFKDKRAAVELSVHIERNVSVYLLTVSCINALVGIATGSVMWLCGVSSPVLWGAVAFMLNFVPILGPMAGIVVFLMASVLSLGVNMVGATASRSVFLYPCCRGGTCDPHGASTPFYHQSGGGHAGLDLLVLDVGCYWRNSCCATTGCDQDHLRRPFVRCEHWVISWRDDRPPGTFQPACRHTFAQSKTNDGDN